jgi:uncharacterized protein (TIGR02270 family)
MPLSPKVVLLRDVLEEHLEELQFLWGLRRESLRSPERTLAQVRRLEARIEAHAEGLLVARGELLDLAGPGLAADDPLAAFASAFVLLRSGPEGARAVMDAFHVSAEGGREGLCEALAHGDIRAVRDELAGCVSSADAALALSATTALAIRQAPGLGERVEERFLGNPEPGLRLAAWRLAPLFREAPRPEAVRRGFEDPEPAVRREAVVAAAWFSLSPALEKCREQVASDPDDAAEWLYLLAVLGDESDNRTVLAAAGERGRAGRGASWPRALGALGHPRGVEALLAMMGDADPARSAAAGAAFRKITGLDVSGDERVAVAGAADSADDSEFDEEFLDEVRLPDPKAAGTFWTGARGKFGSGGRWCHGHDVGDGCPGELPAELDMESRWELRLRGRFTGSWKGEAAGLWRMAPARD